MLEAMRVAPYLGDQPIAFDGPCDLRLGRQTPNVTELSGFRRKKECIVWRPVTNAQARKKRREQTIDIVATLGSGKSGCGMENQSAFYNAGLTSARAIQSMNRPNRYPREGQMPSFNHYLSQQVWSPRNGWLAKNNHLSRCRRSVNVLTLPALPNCNSSPGKPSTWNAPR